MEVQVTHKLTQEQVEQACREFVLRLTQPETVRVEPTGPVTPEYDLTDVVTYVATPNPYRADSERGRRFGLFKVGETLQLAKSQGAHKRDIDHALEKGYIRTSFTREEYMKGAAEQPAQPAQ